MNNRGSAIVIPIILIAGLIAGAFLIYYLVIGPSTETGSNDSASQPTGSANANTNVVKNTNAAAPSTNGNENTNVAIVPEGYSAPVGPFDLNGTSTFAVAYRLGTDRLVTRLAKIVATTGSVAAETQLNAGDIPTELGDQAANVSPSRVAFGADGDSVVFLSGSYSGPLYVGLYRTSFSTPTKIERIIQYDNKNLFRGDIPTIQNFVYHASSNQVAFLIAGNEGKQNNYLKVIKLADKSVVDIATFTTQPELVGFVSDGTAIQVFRKDDTQASDTPVGKAYLENYRVTDGQRARSTLIYDEAKLTPPTNLYTGSAAVSPNVNVFAYNAYSGESRIYFRNIGTGKITTAQVKNPYGSNYAWSSDSGKVFFGSSSGGVVYDLGIGVLATLEKGQNGFLWEPSDLLIFSKQDGKLYSYNLQTKKEVAMPSDIAQFYGDGEGYGYGGGTGILGKAWVSR